MSATDNLSQGQFGRVQANSPVYNDIPETRGTARNRGNYGGQSGRDMADADKPMTSAPHPYNPGCLKCTRGQH